MVETYITDPVLKLINIYQEQIKDFERFRRDLIEEEKESEALKDLIKIENSILIPDQIKRICYYNYVFNHFQSLLKLNLVRPTFLILKDGKREKIEIDYEALTKFLATKYAILSYKDNVFAYVGNKYVEGEGLIMAEVDKLLNVSGEFKTKKISQIKKEVLQRVIDYTKVFEFPFRRYEDIFFLKNGVLLDNPRILLPHGAFWLNLYCLNAKYDPNANSERVDKFIRSLVPEESVKVLYQMIACCLIGKNTRAFMLVGDGSNGKSTFLNMVKSFLGVENVSSIPLQELCNDRFKSAELIGKLANIYADLPEKPIKNAGKFKILTGGDTLIVERKYHHPFEMKNTAVLIFSANNLPYVDDDTFAFWRRWVIVEFPNRFSENEEVAKWAINLPEEDASGLLNEVLKALTEIQIVGVETREADKLKDEWKRRNDSVYAFVKDCVVENSGSWILKDDLYNKYVEYCEQNDYRALAKNSFSQNLLRYVKAKSVRKRVEGGRVQVWEGIKLKEPEEEYLDFSDLESYLSF